MTFPLSRPEGSAIPERERYEPHDDFGGLNRDRPRLVDRRAVLGMFAGAGATAVLAACTTGRSPGAATTAPASGSSSGSSSATSESASASEATSATASGTCTTEAIPQETAGPFPGDGANGPDVLTSSGVVRRDIRSSFGSASGTAAGVPLTLRLTIQDAANGCGVRAGAAVYVWHCDREGRYSLYDDSIREQNYLRGVQVADAAGHVTFTTIFPAAYQGRWPHIHFEVYRTLAEATASAQPYRTSQVALPENVCRTVYATAGYEQSVRNLDSTSLQRDMVFGDDGAQHQLATVTGSVRAGYTAGLDVPV